MVAGLLNPGLATIKGFQTKSLRFPLRMASSVRHHRLVMAAAPIPTWSRSVAAGRRRRVHPFIKTICKLHHGSEKALLKHASDSPPKSSGDFAHVECLVGRT